MKQSGHLNPSEETGTGCSVSLKYGRTPTSKHEGVGREQQHKSCCCLPTPLTLASGGSPIFPLEVHQPASLSIWPHVPNNMIKFRANYIRGCKAYTPFRGQTSMQHQFKTSVLSPTLFSILLSGYSPFYDISEIPQPPAPPHLTLY